jgi:hypothetical protein
MKAKIFLGLMALLFVMPIGFAWSELPTISGRCEIADTIAQESIEPATPIETISGGVSLDGYIRHNYEPVEGTGTVTVEGRVGGKSIDLNLNYLLNDDDIDSEINRDVKVVYDRAPVEGLGEVIL